ncbi:Carboxymuconolactone decarboxylase family protein [Roseivivax sp. THAF40]|uniref:carboxymuconolactone decarboxylase family protein n=1 Tax=unclassified Roseivivax TaxID=2639302 RepID=UPI0012680CCD|nr:MULTISPECIES: carboxymuconolactone decarboxylase family protein [unclassified Roseivivax]QFS82829.1 Carboxymuconolactone decarboxylase family protein [Roseivivax sp. THAF197b]QFT46598.1 Carboxymuconolactone decarboxylase family protein [Roseivivax sp. THAF40]
MTAEHNLAPLPDSNWPSEIADLRDGFAGQLNVYRTMAHHPELLRAWMDLRDHIVNGTALGPVRSEVVILRTGFRLGSEYEWLQHIERARKVGLSDARIATAMGPKAAMSDEDTLLTNAVDELFDTSRLTPATRDAMIASYGKAALLDLMATVGFYSTLGFMLNSFDTPLDDDIRARLEEHPFDP